MVSECSLRLDFRSQEFRGVIQTEIFSVSCSSYLATKPHAQHSAQEQGAAVRAKGSGCSDDRRGSSCKTNAWKKGVLPAEDPTASALSSGRTVRGVWVRGSKPVPGETSWCRSALSTEVL